MTVAGAKLISTRLGICPACGHEARLIAATSDEVLSRCYACGDVTRIPQEVRPAWSVTAAVREEERSRGRPEPVLEHAHPLAG
jgi:uncharacterized Zn finger protein